MTGSRTDAEKLRHAEIALGIAAIALSLFVFGAPLPIEIEFVRVGAVGAVVLVASGLLAILAGLLRRALLSAIGGVMLVLGAVAQVVGLALSTRPLGGDASTMSVVGGLGIALLAITITRRSARHSATD